VYIFFYFFPVNYGSGERSYGTVRLGDSKPRDLRKFKTTARIDWCLTLSMMSAANTNFGINESFWNTWITVSPWAFFDFFFIMNGPFFVAISRQPLYHGCSFDIPIWDLQPIDFGEPKEQNSTGMIMEISYSNFHVSCASLKLQKYLFLFFNFGIQIPFIMCMSHSSGDISHGLTMNNCFFIIFTNLDFKIQE